MAVGAVETAVCAVFQRPVGHRVLVSMGLAASTACLSPPRDSTGCPSPKLSQLG
jgi:hypothetical protein